MSRNPRRGRRNRVPTEPITVTIHDLAHDGRGVAKVAEKVVFVDGALPQEEVIATYTKVKKEYDEAQATEVLVASKDRVEPFCDVYGICGGCRLQHLDADRQIDFKAEQLRSNLSRQAGLTEYQQLPNLRGESQHYRYKARLGVKHVPAKERVLVGFRERLTPYIVDMHRCPILEEKIDALIDPLSEMIGQLSIASKLPQIEVAVGDEAHALSFRVLEAPTEEDLAIFKVFEAEHDLIIYLQPGNESTTIALTEKGASDQALYYRLLDNLTLYFKPYHFTQVNPAMNNKMVKQALSLLDLQGDEQVLDLFCGLGNFTLALATQAQNVIGVEGDKSLTDWAGRNAEFNQISNVEFHCADLTQDQKDAPWMNRHYDAILIDPPRSGALEMMPYLGTLLPKKILYVSCHPATLARDLAVLTKEYPYELVSAGVMDMFPHTAHVESMALLHLKD
ncbi:23S rRNA (uracil(1939)-C(5))-methyltransferase RlmD [Ignatzschineria larvae DSM 13226]|uniref:23S rRNA (uracil(1939)-C(5))-methyltransferase RlmD n=1 Tax=Ignatzschineria larvae DSM 13226 TaxID=1111732 RepID=A0ABZ3BXK2_9GAMM|nr:23S rRNA (uracil(1939)-C(5))-methyltransferase RlmD [Ignatzschineria larvae]